eukprot:3502495-Alexandrium_andersonii.AAC.1
MSSGGTSSGPPLLPCFMRERTKLISKSSTGLSGSSKGPLPREGEEVAEKVAASGGGTKAPPLDAQWSCSK